MHIQVTLMYGAFIIWTKGKHTHFIIYECKERVKHYFNQHFLLDFTDTERIQSIFIKFFL